MLTYMKNITQRRKRILMALSGGIICRGLYKLYLYTYSRAQFEDSNVLVSMVFIIIAAAVIYAVLSLISVSKHS